MTHTAVNIKNRRTLKMEFGMVYRIELPRGLAEGENREWLEGFVENILIKEGAVLDYKIVPASDSLKNYLHIEVRSLGEDTDSEIENESFPPLETSVKESKTNPPASKKRKILKYLRHFLAYCVASPFLILGFLMDKKKVGRFISTVTAICLTAFLCNIIRKVWSFFGGDYGQLPGWLNYFIW